MGATFIAPYFHDKNATNIVALYNIANNVDFPLEFINSHSDGAARTAALYFDCSTTTCTLTYNGLKWEDQYPNYTTSVFKASSNIATINMNAMYVELGSAGAGSPDPASVWDTASKYASAGQIWTNTSGQFNIFGGNFAGLDCYQTANCYLDNVSIGNHTENQGNFSTINTDQIRSISTDTLRFGNNSVGDLFTVAASGASTTTIAASLGTVGSAGYAIAGLPSCNSTYKGQTAYVTNGVTSPVYLATVSTTGSTVAPVFCNGTNWIYH
jgi:hypothetical protein